MLAHEACDALLKTARGSDAAGGLLALGQFVTGHPSYLATAGFTVRRSGDLATPVLDSEGTPLPRDGAVVPEPAFASLGLEIVRVAGCRQTSNDRRARIGGLVWRAGVLLRMLDLAHAHLTGRETAGQKTLQHQLVKACFTECHALSRQVAQEAAYWLAAAQAPDVAEIDARLSAASCKAAKLMGGHGYLRGSLNALECLSLCVSALMRDVAGAQTSAAA